MLLGGGVKVVTVSGGREGMLAGGVLLGLLVGVVDGGAVDGRVVRVAVDIAGRGGTTVALVVALSPLVTMTAVAMAPTAITPPTRAVRGRHRRSAGQSSA